MEQQEDLENDNTNQEIENKSEKTQKTATQSNNITNQNISLQKTKSPSQKQFLLDCDNRKLSRLPTYNGLTDKYLIPFFQNANLRNNLKRAGLINDNNEIIETKKLVIVPFKKLDPIVQRKHICHQVPKKKVMSIQSPVQHMTYNTSTQGSKCVTKLKFTKNNKFLNQFSTSKNKKNYYFEKLPPLKTPTQGTKIHLPEIYLEKNFQKFSTQYLEFLNNSSANSHKSLERQFIEKYKSQQNQKIIRHYKPLHVQVRGVKEDCLAWRFQTELNQQNPTQMQEQFGQKKNNFYAKQQQQEQQQQKQVTKEEDEEYEEEFEKEENNKNNEQNEYGDEDFSEKEEESNNNNTNNNNKKEEKQSEEESNYDEQGFDDAEVQEKDKEDKENEEPMEENQQKQENEYDNDFDDEEIN